MKLTAKIKLLPTEAQATALLATLREANAACNAVSEVAWQTKTFRTFNLHKVQYHAIRAAFNLSAQLAVRVIGKVADAYKLDKKTRRTFRATGAIAFDSRILRYHFAKRQVSIWTVDGRQPISYVGGAHNEALLAYQHGESDLLYSRGKFFLLATCDIPDGETEKPEEILGVDLGIRELATDSDGEAFSGAFIRAHRKKRQVVRTSLQRKQAAEGASRSTKKNTGRVLRRLAGRERTTSKVINHTISKRLVGKAKATNRALAIENLEGIRERTVKRLPKAQRREHSSWPFYQMRQFITYKASLAGVALYVVPAPYTSKTCSGCLSIGQRNKKRFICTNCGYQADADHNGARMIAAVGASHVNAPENSMLYCAWHGGVLGLNSLVASERNLKQSNKNRLAVYSSGKGVKG